MKWFGCKVIGPTITGIGFTAITSVGNIAGTIMTSTSIFITTTTSNQSITKRFETPAFGPAFCFPSEIPLLNSVFFLPLP